MAATRTKQLEVVTPDEVGTMARLFQAIADAGVNIKAYSAWTRENKGHFLLVTEDNATLERVAQKQGFETRSSEVITVETTDKIGAGAALVKKLADAGINIEISYGSSVGKGEYLSVFHTSDDAKAVQALR